MVDLLGKPTAETDTEGDFGSATSDSARIDTEGCMRITRRAKDIISHGAENTPVVEDMPRTPSGTIRKFGCGTWHAVLPYHDRTTPERGVCDEL